MLIKGKRRDKFSPFVFNSYSVEELLFSLEVSIFQSVITRNRQDQFFFVTILSISLLDFQLVPALLFFPFHVSSDTSIQNDVLLHNERRETVSNYKLKQTSPESTPKERKRLHRNAISHVKITADLPVDGRKGSPASLYLTSF